MKGRWEKEPRRSEIGIIHTSSLSFRSIKESCAGEALFDGWLGWIRLLALFFMVEKFIFGTTYFIISICSFVVWIGNDGIGMGQGSE